MGTFTSGSWFWWSVDWCGDQVSKAPRIWLLTVTIAARPDTGQSTQRGYRLNSEPCSWPLKHSGLLHGQDSFPKICPVLSTVGHSGCQRPREIHWLLMGVSFQPPLGTCLWQIWQNPKIDSSKLRNFFLSSHRECQWVTAFMEQHRWKTGKARPAKGHLSHRKQPFRKELGRVRLL